MSPSKRFASLCDDVRPVLDEAVDDSHVVVEVVLAARLQHVARVHDGALDEAAGRVDGVDADFEVLEVVQGVKHAEDFDPGVFC